MNRLTFTLCLLFASLASLPPLLAQPTLEDQPDPVQRSGTLVKVKGQVLEYENKEEGKSEVTVEEEAEIVLNGKAARLADLKNGDKLNLKVRESNPSLVYDIRAARVVVTPPSDPPATPVRPMTTPLPRNAENPETPAASLGLVLSDSPDKGIMVVGVMAGSPAELGGVLLCDFLLMINGQAIETPQDYLKAMSKQEPGKPVKVLAWRQGKTLDGTFQAAAASSFPDMVAIDPRVPLLAALQNAQQVQPPSYGLEVDVQQGAVIIKSVHPNSPAALAGFLPGDVIMGINGTNIGTLDAYQSVIQGFRPGTAAQFQINRNNVPQNLNFNPAPSTTDLPGSTRQPQGTFANPNQGTLPSANPLDE